jgi:manganese transport protein
MCRLAGMFAPDDLERRLAFRSRFVVLLTVVPIALFWTFQSPVTMVMLGGIAQSLMLPIVGIAALFLRHRRLPRDARPSAMTTAALWVTTALIVVVMGYYMILTYNPRS